MDSLINYSRTKAVKKLFDINLSKHSSFKNRISTLEDNKSLNLVIEKPTGSIGSRGKRYYLDSQLDRLHNVILISGFYSKPAIIKDIVNNPARRQEHVDVLRELLVGRDRIGDIQLNVETLENFLTSLEQCLSFDNVRLPNPFIQLPHVIDNGSGKSPCVLEAYSNSDIVLTKTEKMLAAYLDCDIELAYQLSHDINFKDGATHKFKDWIEKEYHEAQRFDELLEDFFN